MESPEILEGKLEAQARPADELGWPEIWMLTVITTCAFLVCMVLVHHAIVKP